ncbi:hypothetical protein C3B51_00600 [Pseudoalteromonas rubra]|uniref:Uncharacterized protein n=1 Tax=Pseudoalteromonas rubra TaxID=43658 RepID=A0A4Q7EN90_9GAMM|nr:hypothetical protein [Pseudoalteromonas rubra]RZM85472.1 hypothetical protein C3B51_00600 [Pseudoalteromonas rubra]
MSNKTVEINEDNSHGDENPLWGFEKDAEWRNAFRRLISYSWISDDKLKEVVNEPLEMMRKLSDYTPPSGLYIRFRGLTSDNQVIETPLYNEFNKESLIGYSYNDSFLEKKHPVNGWLEASSHLPTEVIFTLPPAPSGEDIKAYALADYEAKGKEMPFTCC